MDRMKTFFIYFLIVLAFLIFTRIMIYVGINTTYSEKEIKNNTPFYIETQLKATSINGVLKYKFNSNEYLDRLKDCYIKFDCYSKNEVLMGTKYIKIDSIKANEEVELRFNFNRVEKAKLSIVATNNVEEDIKEENTTSDPERGFVAIVSALILLSII